MMVNHGNQLIFMMVFMMVKIMDNHGFKMMLVNGDYSYINGWWFETWLLYDFPYIGNGIIIPTVTHSIIFQRD